MSLIRRALLDLTKPVPHIQYFRELIEIGHKKAGSPLTEEEIQALDTFDAAISSPSNMTAHKLLRGEMLIIDNNTQLHSREPFKLTGQGKDQPARLLLRVWTRSSNPV